ncbi:hypothetical protein [Kitasatospora sp. NPDC097643]|uniref:hypothetical protein n=1 Tax=Kitasatospora sp. NPDC097643 TaxID=3157230 RepID=UPI0033223130
MTPRHRTQRCSPRARTTPPGPGTAGPAPHAAQHTELVTEIAEEPNYDAALAALR